MEEQARQIEDLKRKEQINRAGTNTRMEDLERNDKRNRAGT